MTLWHKEGGARKRGFSGEGTGGWCVRKDFSGLREGVKWSI